MTRFQKKFNFWKEFYERFSGVIWFVLIGLAVIGAAAVGGGLIIMILASIKDKLT
jgi:hypothetical protein